MSVIKQILTVAAVTLTTGNLAYASHQHSGARVLPQRPPIICSCWFKLSSSGVGQLGNILSNTKTGDSGGIRINSSGVRRATGRVVWLVDAATSRRALRS